MLDVGRDANLDPGAVRLLRDLKAAGQPIVLSLNGQADLAVEDAESFELLVRLVDRLETIAVLRRRLKDADAGDAGLSLDEAKDQVRKAHGIPL